MGRSDRRDARPIVGATLAVARGERRRARTSLALRRGRERRRGDPCGRPRWTDGAAVSRRARAGTSPAPTGGAANVVGATLVVARDGRTERRCRVGRGRGQAPPPTGGAANVVGATLVVARDGRTERRCRVGRGRGQAPPLRAVPRTSRRGDPCGRPRWTDRSAVSRRPRAGTSPAPTGLHPNRDRRALRWRESRVALSSAARRPRGVPGKHRCAA